VKNLLEAVLEVHLTRTDGIRSPVVVHSSVQTVLMAVYRRLQRSKRIFRTLLSLIGGVSLNSWHI